MNAVFSPAQIDVQQKRYERAVARIQKWIGSDLDAEELSLAKAQRLAQLICDREAEAANLRLMEEFDGSP